MLHDTSKTQNPLIRTIIIIMIMIYIAHNSEILLRRFTRYIDTNKIFTIGLFKTFPIISTTATKIFLKSITYYHRLIQKVSFQTNNGNPKSMNTTG